MEDAGKNNVNYPNWEKDNISRLALQRNFMLVISILALVASSFAILFMQRMKNTHKIEPIVIEVEDKTGVATIIKNTRLNQYTEDEAVKRHLIFKYIKSREGYTEASYKYNYSTLVRFLSSESVYFDYRKTFSKNNPQSPINILGNGSNIVVAMKSIIFRENNVADVRFQAKTIGNKNIVDNKIAYIEYTFDTGKTSEAARLENPLGFKVIKYIVDNERT